MFFTDSESAHRKRVARSYLLFIFVALRTADYLLFWYSSLPGNASPLLSGAAVGSVLCTTTLLIGLWRRQSWARYVLIAVMWGLLVLISYPLMVAWGRRELAPTLPFLLIGTAVLLYSISTTLLICSKRIRHLGAKSMVGR